MGAIRREMNSAKWTALAIGYQCGLAYAVSLMVYQFGMLFAGKGNVIGVIAASLLLVFLGYLLFRPYQTGKKNK
jgi:ferrous iron transport protein B